MLRHLRTVAIVGALACACFALTYASSALALNRPRLQELRTDVSSRLAVDYSVDAPRAALLPPLSPALIKDAAIDNALPPTPTSGGGPAGVVADTPLPAATGTPTPASGATHTPPATAAPTETPTPRPSHTPAPDPSGTPTSVPTATYTPAPTPAVTQQATCVIKILPGGSRTCVTPVSIATATPAPPTLTPLPTDTPAPATPTAPAPTNTPDPTGGGGSSGGAPG